MRTRLTVLFSSMIVFAAIYLPVDRVEVALAEDKKPEASKPPDPFKALQAAVAGLARSKNYKVRVGIEGGIADNANHEVREVTVRESYQGEVFGPLMHVPAVKAFRYPKKGVAYVEGQWRNILAHPRTMRLERLFGFPEVILGRALNLAPKTARWLTPEEEAAAGLAREEQDDEDEDESTAEEEEDESEEEDSEEEDAEKPTGKKKPADGKAGKKEGEKKSPSSKTKAVKPGGEKKTGPMPRVVQVEAPPKEAIKHFIEVQNSGCMSEG